MISNHVTVRRVEARPANTRNASRASSVNRSATTFDGASSNGRYSHDQTNRVPVAVKRRLAVCSIGSKRRLSRCDYFILFSQLYRSKPGSAVSLEI